MRFSSTAEVMEQRPPHRWYPISRLINSDYEYCDLGILNLRISRQHSGELPIVAHASLSLVDVLWHCNVHGGYEQLHRSYPFIHAQEVLVGHLRWSYRSHRLRPFLPPIHPEYHSALHSIRVETAIPRMKAELISEAP